MSEPGADLATPSQGRGSPAFSEPPLRFDPRLVEEAVLLAVAACPAEEQRRFRAARDPIYRAEPAARERRFDALHAAWFDRLGLAEPLRVLLAEQPSIASAVAACVVVPAARGREEHADLRRVRGSRVSAPGSDGEGGRPVLILELLPATLVAAAELERLLRRELYYVADMLDPAFGYDPALAVEETSGPLASVVRARHETLWRITVEGRLALRGEPARAELERLRARFEAAFPLFPRSREATFRALLEGPRPTHRELLRLARDPGGGDSGSSVCPLCRLPAPAEELGRPGLSWGALVAVRRDYPDWRPEHGICPHCGDLYELRGRARPTTGGVAVALPAAATPRPRSR